VNSVFLRVTHPAGKTGSDVATRAGEGNGFKTWVALLNDSVGLLKGDGCISDWTPVAKQLVERKSIKATAKIENFFIFFSLS